MPDLSELDLDDRIKVSWGKRGWKRATVLNIEIPQNNNPNEYIFTLRYDDPTILLIRDTLRLRWNFLSESPKFKSKKNLV